ncbi:MAG: hypothetical protein ACFWUC_11720 [Oscillospiraceae bacterium]
MTFLYLYEIANFIVLYPHGEQICYLLFHFVEPVTISDGLFLFAFRLRLQHLSLKCPPF